MLIKIKKNSNLYFKNFKFKCVLGKNGTKANKIEGDKATPKGIYTLGKLYYRNDRLKKINTNLICKKINKTMGWCNDSSSKYYNKEIKINKKIKYEKLFRNDYKYDLLIVINYNKNPIIKNKGSAIFLHLTKKYKPTLGCIAIKIKDFIKLAKFLNKNTKIEIK